MRTFHVLINPGSGGGEAEQKRALLQAIFDEAGERCEFPVVASPQALDAACLLAAQRAQREDGVLVAVGGDGTLNSAARAALEAGCTLGVIPQGTFNYFGRAHGISQDAQEAARAMLRAQPQPVQVGLVNGRAFLVNASLGLYPQLLQDRETFKNQFGRHRWVAVIAALATLFKWRHQLSIEIETKDQRFRVRTPTLVVGNNALQLQQLGMPPELVAAAGQGALVGAVVRPIGTAALLGLLLRGAFGRLGEAQQVDSFAFQRITVDVRGMTRVKVAADGEVGRMAPPLRFEVSPRPLMLLVPLAQDRVEVE
ncbi:MAG TPA: diacylglycerol kinase family protein [Ramlibacter sp.]|nr:diacylglycerol kinase family protein [Ramlibacter sp.]